MVKIIVGAVLALLVFQGCVAIPVANGKKFSNTDLNKTNQSVVLYRSNQLFASALPVDVYKIKENDLAYQGNLKKNGYMKLEHEAGEKSIYLIKSRPIKLNPNSYMNLITIEANQTDTKCLKYYFAEDLILPTISETKCDNSQIKSTRYSNWRETHNFTNGFSELRREKSGYMGLRLGNIVDSSTTLYGFEVLFTQDTLGVRITFGEDSSYNNAIFAPIHFFANDFIDLRSNFHVSFGNYLQYKLDISAYITVGKIMLGYTYDLGAITLGLNNQELPTALLEQAFFVGYKY